MDYRITYEDGSEAYLEHYGVKGMKWHKHLKREVNYEGLLGATRDADNAGEFARNVGGLVYENTAKPYVDEAKKKAESALDNYKAFLKRDREISDSEREALRKKAREEKRARKQESRKKIEQLLGIGD